jgi:hypothetical protein
LLEEREVGDFGHWRTSRKASGNRAVQQPNRSMAAPRKGTRRERNQRLRSPADLPEGTWKQGGSNTEPVDGFLAEGYRKREKPAASVAGGPPGRHLEAGLFKHRTG